MSVQTVEPENTNPAPAPSSTPLGKLMFRFVGLLFLAVGAMAIVWSR